MKRRKVDMVIKVKYEVRTQHVHARIFMGLHPDHLTMCGNLMFKHDEWEFFHRCLKDGSMLVKGAEVILSDSTGGSSSVNPRIVLPSSSSSPPPPPGEKKT